MSFWGDLKVANWQICHETGKGEKTRESLPEPAEGISPGWGTSSFPMSQGGEFCSQAQGFLCGYNGGFASMALLPLNLPSGIKHIKKY